MNTHWTWPLLATGIFLMSISTLPAYGQGRIVRFQSHYQVPDEADFIAVSAGFHDDLALRSDGSIAAWGGDNTGIVSGAPTGTGFTAVSAGYSHALALREDTSIVSWGWDLNTPTGTGFAQVCASIDFSLALRTDGSIVAWGEDLFGQVSGAPTGTGFKQVDAGNRHCVALRNDGSIVAWGWDYGELISGAPSGTGFTQVSAGHYHSLALRADGSIAVWGSGGNPPEVLDVPVGTGFTQVQAGPNVSFALTPDGTIVGWGQDVWDLFHKPSGSGFTQISLFIYDGMSQGQSVALLGGAVGVPYCYGDGSSALCPCFNHGDLRQGCANSTLFGGGALSASGAASLSNDTFQLAVEGLPNDTFGLIILGQAQANIGAGSTLGDGLFCVSGLTVRSQVQFAATGSTTFTDFNGLPIGQVSFPVGSQSNYQYWYRDFGNTCSGSGFNFSNAWAVTWKP